MEDAFKALMSSLGVPSSHGASHGDGDSLWFRAGQRFDIRARWLHEEHGLELMAAVRPVDAGTSDEFDDDDDDEAWCREDVEKGPWHYVTMWHLPTSYVCLVARAEAGILDAVSLRDFVGGFIDHLQEQDDEFNGSGERESGQELRSAPASHLP